ncbi:O-antigen ligase family protein [Candidatus Neptunochlamydia vexilliferae]|uniref:O-antigen ligase family protein n=1 Tax=Candidatus Neptunichlamydia vexilliferae TaxID=1651774 RepID=UPI00189133F8|nr:O-antigen ligase family protein [Candidatus Neptunochlamydia vexilliferae]
MLILRKIQYFLIYCFVFFGPLGTLLTPSFMPYAFRFYHFFLLLTPLLFFRLKTDQWKTVLTFVPFLAYCLISAYFTHNKEVDRDAYPLFRAFLFVSQCLFMFGAAFCLEEKARGRLIRLYLAGFLISLIMGYTFYLGYYSGKISFATLQKYSVETQMGWGLLRFSPGTYPNEYGNVSSFVLAILLIAFAKKPRFLLFVFASLTFIALLLTTTRAAYLSFLVTVIYLCMTSRSARKVVIQFSVVCLLFLFILKYYSIDFFTIFINGVKAISLNYGSTGVRFTEWIKGAVELNGNVFFGNGFGANILTHNIYLELLYELGIVGIVVLVVTLVYFFSQTRLRRLSPITIVGLIHVFLFAGSNHNMHHHLTWFTLLLLSNFLFQKDEASAFSNRSPLSLPA